MTIRLAVFPKLFLVALFFGFTWHSLAGAEEKSYYSPIIHVDKEKGWIVISSSGAVFAVQATDASKPHLEKLPISGLIDIVVETQKEGPPLIKRWKVTSGDSSCRVFDGKDCK